MGRYTDEQLAQLMCQIYVEYYDTKTELIDDLIEKKINQKIRELSNNTQKTEKHLKSLIDDFFGSFTPEQQRKIKITKDEIKKHKKITVLDRIEGLSEEELREYLKTVPAHKITAKLNSIIERKNQERAAKAKKILEQIKALSKEQKAQEMEEHKNAKYMVIKELFDTIVNNGYFSIAHFSKENHSKYGLDYKMFMNRIKLYIDFLKKEYPQDYNNYQYLMEKNMWISWEKNRYQIERIIFGPEKYDIVDYYMYINLPPKTFLKLCRYMYDDIYYSKIKAFIERYFDQPSYNPKNDNWIKTSSYIINNEKVTIETQELILNFMKENNIPTNFFTTCLAKYRNNELNIESKTK